MDRCSSTSRTWLMHVASTRHSTAYRTMLTPCSLRWLFMVTMTLRVSIAIPSSCPTMLHDFRHARHRLTSYRALLHRASRVMRELTAYPLNRCTRTPLHHVSRTSVRCASSIVVRRYIWNAALDTMASPNETYLASVRLALEYLAPRLQ